VKIIKAILTILFMLQYLYSTFNLKKENSVNKNVYYGMQAIMGLIWFLWFMR
jgi:hypothetical protein